MKIVNLLQGTPEWHAHRAQHLNASDAPAMLGMSSYKTRSQLLRVMSTGIAPDVDAATQRRFDAGHRYEALARPIAEEIIGEELYPCVGTEGRYSASFDGLTLLEDTAFEHKSLNDDLRAAFADMDTINPEHRERSAGKCLPELYRVQMEQQCMVSGAERVLFMASKWNGDQLVEELHCWYMPDPQLRSRIVAGWEQFEADLAGFQPVTEAAVTVVGQAPGQLPALRIEVTGMVTASNLAEFKDSAIAVFKGIRTDLQSDQDFADAERTVKWCGDIEDRLEGAKQHALSQTQSIDELFKAIDAISEEARATRLKLDKLVKARKESIRTEIVDKGRAAVAEHYQTINANLGEHAIATPAALVHDLGAAIKGKKTMASMHDAVNTAVANAKIAASQQAERVRGNVAILAQHQDHASLFADRILLCANKEPEDLRNLVQARIAEHLERERAKQEAVRVEAERTKPAPEPEQPVKQEPTAQTVATPVSYGRAAPVPPPADNGQRLKLGDINARLWPLSVTVEGLTTLGFSPVGTDRAAKLYAASEFPAMCAAMQTVLTNAQHEHQAAA